MAPPSGDQVRPVIVLSTAGMRRDLLAVGAEDEARVALGDGQHVALRAPGDDVDRLPPGTDDRHRLVGAELQDAHRAVLAGGGDARLARLPRDRS